MPPNQAAKQPSNRAIQAVFFDLDDTLCGYWEASKAALRETFERHGPPGHTTEKLLDAWGIEFLAFLPEIKSERWYEAYLRSGEPTRTELMRRALLRLGIEDPERADLLSQRYLELRHANLKLFPDALPVLKALRGVYPLGLITNGPADTQRMEIDTLDIGDYFDHVFIEGELGFGKPEREVFRRAELAVGFSAGRILFVGDSYAHDILPAIEAGWKTAWKRKAGGPPSPAGSRPTVGQRPTDMPAPNVEITSLRELLPFLASATS